MKMPCVMIMAGGTGGHVYPALAVAERLRAAGAGVVWLGTHAGLEARVVPAAGFPIEWLPVLALRGKGLLRRLAAPFMLARALMAALVVLRRHRPRAVLGLGGYVTGPGGVGAWLMRIPLLIHEQNAIPGLTNRWLAHLARVVMEAFPGSFSAQACAQHTGNPVRAAIAQLPAHQSHAGRTRLLVLGGSLGARALNRTLPEALAQLSVEQRPEVWHQTGSAHADEVPGFYRAAGVEARIAPFIEDMAAAYAWADLVLCRAGALTIAELACAGLPALLVPYPHAVDDHQTHNARYLSEHGAALLIAQTDLTAMTLAGTLRMLLADPARLAAMAQAARVRALPDATERVAALALSAAGAAHV
jgi:UDP-N-acetylglucosamine--N-acetylmuramyl-(pentapeptide) pyrophosphoryl-undecaprenol N-acetylglucosamine transferase